jgi:protein-S-isoprenylcysteine O-methyltransferase Ste14
MPYVDDYKFEIGYQGAVILTSYCIALLFSTVAPYVTIFAVPFFVLKYFVDKYNVTFVYVSEYQSTGKMVDQLIPLTVCAIVLSQLTSSVIITSNFSTKEKIEGYGATTLVISIIELVLFVVYLCWDRSVKYAKMKKLKVLDTVLD